MNWPGTVSQVIIQFFIDAMNYRFQEKCAMMKLHVKMINLQGLLLKTKYNEHCTVKWLYMNMKSKIANQIYQ